jgi:hypothetical protein
VAKGTFASETFEASTFDSWTWQGSEVPLISTFDEEFFVPDSPTDFELPPDNVPVM